MKYVILRENIDIINPLNGDAHFNSDAGMKSTEQKLLLKHSFLPMLTLQFHKNILTVNDLAAFYLLMLYYRRQHRNKEQKKEREEWKKPDMKYVKRHGIIPLISQTPFLSQLSIK